MSSVNIGPGGGGSTVSKDIATDVIAAVDHQLVKVEFGAAGAATQVSAANPLPASPRCGTGTFSTVAGAAIDTQLLAVNAARLGATIFNDSTAVLKVALGFVSSATNFTVLLNPNAYYEVPFGFTGIIKGIWASATGNARLTEMTA